MSERAAALRAAAIVVVATKLAVAKLAHHIPPLSLALGCVSLDLAYGMMETRPSPPSSQNGGSKAMLRALPLWHAHGWSSPSPHQNPSHLG